MRCVAARQCAAARRAAVRETRLGRLGRRGRKVDGLLCCLPLPALRALRARCASAVSTRATGRNQVSHVCGEPCGAPHVRAGGRRRLGRLRGRGLGGRRRLRLRLGRRHGLRLRLAPSLLRGAAEAKRNAHQREHQGERAASQHRRRQKVLQAARFRGVDQRGQLRRQHGREAKQECGSSTALCTNDALSGTRMADARSEHGVYVYDTLRAR